ncbi:MAG: hypothetical protein ACI32E_07075 [Bacilli bacterium]
MKRKTLSLTLCLLTCLALIGVGFAAWLITYNSSAEKTGNITVETVSTRTYQVVVTDVANEIRFTAPQAQSAPYKWLTSSLTDSGFEQLTAVFTVVVNITGNGEQEKVQVNYPGKGSTDNALPTITNELAIVDTVSTAWATALSNKVVADLTVADVEWTENVNDGKYTYTVEVTGKWGDHFENKNPYDFYNSKASASAFVSGSTGPTWGEDAAEYLGYVAALEEVTFKLTITVAAPTTSA